MTSKVDDIQKVKVNVFEKVQKLIQISKAYMQIPRKTNSVYARAHACHMHVAHTVITLKPAILDARQMTSQSGPERPIPCRMNAQWQSVLLLHGHVTAGSGLAPSILAIGRAARSAVSGADPERHYPRPAAIRSPVSPSRSPNEQGTVGGT